MTQDLRYRLVKIMAMQKTIIGAGVAVAAVLMLTSVLALLQSSQTIPNNGTVKAINVGVYLDSACTQNCTTLAWGTVSPGSSSVKTVYVKNQGSAPMTLNMTTNTWTPSSAASYITLTWNRESAVVTAGSNVQADLTLSVSSGITGITNFSFNIIITGIE